MQTSKNNGPLQWTSFTTAELPNIKIYIGECLGDKYNEPDIFDFTLQCEKCKTCFEMNPDNTPDDWVSPLIPISKVVRQAINHTCKNKRK